MDETAKILIVEDNAIVAEDIKTRIQEMGYQVTECVTRGAAAIDSVERIKPDLILMDIKLKGQMSGTQAARIIRTRHDIPVIYLTSYADENTLEDAKLTEPAGYIIKPFDEKDLRSTLKISIYKHQMEKKLKISEEWMRTTLRSIGDGVIATDKNGCVSFMNPVAQMLTGWSEKEAIGKPLDTVFNIVNEQTRKLCENPVAKVIETGQIIGLANHTVLISRDGKERPIKDSGAPIFLDNKDMVGVVLVFQDDSKSREEERKLRESEERFKKLFEYAPLPYQSLDEKGHLVEVNHTWLEILGYQKEEVIGKSFGDFLHPEWIAHFKENFPRFKSIGEVMGVEFEMKKKDGTFITTRFDGKVRRSQTGDFIQTHCVFRDTSIEKNLQKRLNDQETALRQSQKLEAIGTLAGGIAHDFNNILSSVIGYTELALQDTQGKTDLHENLIEVLRAGERAKTLVKQILTFSRKGEQEKTPVQINSMIVDAVKMLQSTIPSNIEIKIQVCPEPLIITANNSQVNQILINLVTNAAHAIEDNGVIEIGLELITLNKNHVVQYPDLLPGNYAKIYVSDTGCGIAKENIPYVFDPYFTTKTPDKGTGLGLAVVHGIVKIHGGHITVYSEENKGTTFHVYLPLSIQPLEKRTDQTEQKIEHGRENILFVDDEPTIGKLQKRILERLGYHVIAKASSKDALEFFKSDPQSIHLVITDMTMPEMTGDKLSLAIKDIRPDIPIILCTGFSEKVNAATASDLPIDAFLMKPVETKKMAQTIRNLLDNANR